VIIADKAAWRSIPGVKPCDDLNARVRWLWSEKPAEIAALASVSPPRIRRLADCTRRSRTNADGVNPVTCLKSRIT
jgi:hypothetical protein